MVEIEAGLVLVAGPAAEAVDLADAKAWARVSAANTADDAIFSALIPAARRIVEGAKDGTLVLSSYVQTLDRFPVVWWSGIGSSGAAMPQVQGGYYGPETQGLGIIRMKRGPLAGVTSIQYVDVSGVLQTLDPSLYQVDTSTPGGRILPAYGTVWPATRGQAAAVQIAYTAGYATPAAVPPGYAAALKIMVAWMYEHRGDDAGAGLPPAVEALLDDFGSGRCT